MSDPKPLPSLSLRHLSLAWLSCMVLVYSDVALGQEDPMEIVATAVRQNGYECESPESAKPDPQHSTPGEKAWIIRCENGLYQVKFLGDRGAEVKPISE